MKRLDASLLAIDGDHGRAGREKSLGNGLTDALPSAGYNRGLSSRVVIWKIMIGHLRMLPCRRLNGHRRQ